MLNFTRQISKLPALSSNFFDIFSLPRKFDINLVELARTYRSLQTSFHPDKHVSGSAEVQEHAAESSALLNKAYTCLRDPYCRARTLLKAKNHNPNITVMDSEFLFDMMEFNDQIEMCDDAETLTQLRIHNEEALAELYSQFEKYFKGRDLETAAERLAKVKFLMQTRERLELRAEVIG